MQPETAIKGQSLRQNLDVLREFYGDAVTRQIVSELDPEFRDLAEEGRLLPSSWYPIRWANDLYRVALQVVPDPADLPERLARRGVERDMEGIYGFLARLLSPEFCIRQAPRVLATYYRGASISAEVLEPGIVELQFSGCVGFSRALWRDTIAGACRIFEESGAKDIRSSFTEGGRDGDSTACVVLHWT